MLASSVKIPPQAFEIFRPFARMIAEEMLEIQRLNVEPPAEETPQEVELPEGKRILRGISGIMEIFKCSRSQAARIKDSGIIDSAITKISAKIFLVNEERALEAMEKKKKGGRRY